MRTFDNEQTVYDSPAAQLPCGIDMPPNLMTSGEPAGIPRCAAFGPLSLDHNERVRSQEDSVRSGRTLEDVPGAIHSFRTQKVQGFFNEVRVPFRQARPAVVVRRSSGQATCVPNAPREQRYRWRQATFRRPAEIH